MFICIIPSKIHLGQDIKIDVLNFVSVFHFLNFFFIFFGYCFWLVSSCFVKK